MFYHPSVSVCHYNYGSQRRTAPQLGYTTGMAPSKSRTCLRSCNESMKCVNSCSIIPIHQSQVRNCTGVKLAGLREMVMTTLCVFIPKEMLHLQSSFLTCEILLNKKFENKSKTAFSPYIIHSADGPLRSIKKFRVLKTLTFRNIVLSNV